MGTADAGEFNQAMMELGALVCVPRNPKCDACPVCGFCGGVKRKMQGKLPFKKIKKTAPHYECAVGVIYRDGKILIAKRKADGLLGGLWEFPGGKKEKGETLKECLKREIREETGIEVQIKNALPQVNHAYSHFRVTLYPFICFWISGEARSVHGEEVKWVLPGEIHNYAFPSANRKIFPYLKDLA